MANEQSPDLNVPSTQHGRDDLGVTDLPPAEEPTAAPTPLNDLDPGRSLRTWIWMAGVSVFGLFVVLGSVPAHFWEENAAGTYYVPVQKSMKVLDIWRAQVTGLPDVSNQIALKTLFLSCVFAFLGLAVIALWLAVVELWAKPNLTENDLSPNAMPEVGQPALTAQRLADG